MWVTVHHPHLPMTCGEQTEQDGGTKRNGGTNGGTKRAFSPRLIGEFGSLYITRFGAFWQRDDVLIGCQFSGVIRSLMRSFFRSWGGVGAGAGFQRAAAS